MEFKVMKKVLEANDHLAADVRALLQEHGICMFNMISSAGAGKTSLLEKSLPLLKEKYRIGIIEGDLETDRDAMRLKSLELPMVLLNTQGACHLDSQSILNALKELPLNDLDLVFVENVGNLVCPAEFDIGENAKIALFSTPEGEDKPMKYPLLFRQASLLVLNKVDLCPVLDFQKDAFLDDVYKLNPQIDLIECSVKQGLGIDLWIDWLEKKQKDACALGGVR